MPRPPLLCVLALGLLGASAVLAEPEERGAKAISSEPELLRADQIHNILIARGVLTTLRFTGGKPIDDVRVGNDKLFRARVDEDGQKILLTGTVESGSTNMTVTIDNADYVFLVQVTPAPSKVMFTRTYSIGGGAHDELMADLMRLGRAPKMKPGDIDAASLVRRIRRAETDLTYRQTLGDLRELAIKRPYSWKGCIVQIMSAYAFLDSDVVVLRVEWVNTSGLGIYLNSSQLGVRCSGKRIRISTSCQDATDSWVHPGQLDTLWLVIQGERIAYANPWDLVFPY